MIPLTFHPGVKFPLREVPATYRNNAGVIGAALLAEK